VPVSSSNTSAVTLPPMGPPDSVGMYVTHSNHGGDRGALTSKNLTRQRAATSTNDRQHDNPAHDTLWRRVYSK
jgi:hypothetical protein